MQDQFNRLAKILRVQPELLLNLEQKMASITGQEGVIEKIAEENDLLVNRTLDEIGLSKASGAQEVRQALQSRLIHLDKELFQILDKPDLSKISKVCGKLCEASISLVNQQMGFFIKRDRAVELLSENPPKNLLEFFGYANVEELIAKESFESVFAALRFTQTTEWMHNFFDTAYNNLGPDDFEEKAIRLKVLEEKWLKVAEKFLEKKYHNVSHLKELGIIFIIPLKLDTPGEITRIFTLILHYLNEVPFYSKLFRKFISEENFSEKLKSLLRGDVLDKSKAESLKSKADWLIIQRYLAKDDENDSRLFMPHINPEAEHWFKAEESLAKLPMKAEDTKGLNFGFWKGLDFVGDFLKNDGGEELVSFDLIDVVMTLVQKEKIKYLYHQQEALWNKIFIEYLGRNKMNELIEQNVIKGYIEF
ncbi:MAG: hypothetical protein A2913_00460 [Parcubacteria group bacterium RIFCSPLOWO2_01_FULL_40_65]|nr:MAG: hypothetical protein A2734_00530 [Parcubacteria group bacterium RIFCSPHIGHO2_01_FULL_40_30]OHB19214.1 MAG: hypothetical protein A3D40_00050 [Parcubacteria group bacterium RIFCSPHIGHO2_02_FULL_40_12]OHB22216.1 MAG: hypothetical protein A2913_00460 [Parcubacteria group bacterium RIFCSPLOWO2_01_FULL_40_65]OHB23291.1 MAG: hypothetical protein A3I22_02855 [Parcubacteria group bacterium RIFCSPLOWO2_02_FULL_40_12]OHB24116.1 MAG: hypothetical protein A3F96_01505 [Parcubacteria group bacterium R